MKTWQFKVYKIYWYCRLRVTNSMYRKFLLLMSLSFRSASYMRMVRNVFDEIQELTVFMLQADDMEEMDIFSDCMEKLIVILYECDEAMTQFRILGLTDSYYDWFCEKEDLFERGASHSWTPSIFLSVMKLIADEKLAESRELREWVTLM